MRFIVASVAKILTEDNKNWRNFKTVVAYFNMCILIIELSIFFIYFVG